MAIGEKTELEVTSRAGGAPEQKLFGRYTLKKVLGRGGMGIVWLAADDELKRNVAMKFLPDMLIRDREAVEDLKRETRRSLDLTHHHIVRIYDFTQDDACAAIIMEYVDGETLSSMKTQQPGGCFGVSVIAPWIGHFCMALDYAHRQARVVHRDLKPANLMVNGRGDLKVTDFGISRSMSDSMTRVSVSNTAGTLAYMSPEQALGAPPAPGDDVYAFGATVFDLLTGRPPFFRGNLQVQLETVIPPPMMERRAELGNTAEPIPALWEEVIAACLCKRPQDRPQSLGEVASMLGVAGPSSTGGRPYYGGFGGGLPGTQSTNAAQPGTSPTQARTMMPEEMATRADASAPGTSPGTARAVPPASPVKGAVRATSLNDIIPGYDAAPARPSNRTAPVQPPATARPATQPVRPAQPATQPPPSQPATQPPASQPATQHPTSKPPTQPPRPATLSQIEPSEDDAAHTIIAMPNRAKAAPTPSVVVPVLPPLAPAPVAPAEEAMVEPAAAEAAVVEDEMPPVIEEAEIVEPEQEAQPEPQVELEPEPIPEEVTMRRVEPVHEPAPEPEPEVEVEPVEPIAPAATARIKIPVPADQFVLPPVEAQPYQTSRGFEQGAPISSPGKSKAGLFVGVAIACLAIGIAAWMGTRTGEQGGQNQDRPIDKPVVAVTPADEAAPFVTEANRLFTAGDLDAAEAKAKEAQSKDPANQGAKDLLAAVTAKREGDKRIAAEQLAERTRQEDAKKLKDAEDAAAMAKRQQSLENMQAIVVRAKNLFNSRDLDGAEAALKEIPSEYAQDPAVAALREDIKNQRTLIAAANTPPPPTAREEVEPVKPVKSNNTETKPKKTSRETPEKQPVRKPQADPPRRQQAQRDPEPANTRPPAPAPAPVNTNKPSRGNSPFRGGAPGG
jgi:serine/threonine protein kinase